MLIKKEDTTMAAEYSSEELEKFDNEVGAQEIGASMNMGESGGKTIDEALAGVDNGDSKPLNVDQVFEAGM